MWRFLWDTSTQTNRNAVLTAGWLLVFNTLGLVLAGVAWGPYWSGAVLWGMALASASFVIGFLFGVPKFEKPADPSDPHRGGLSVNTNLERVSDWLTNIIVGLTLVNLGKIETYGGRLAEHMVKLSGGNAVPVTWAIAMIIYFPSMGFLGGYLLTRMFLSQAFGEADRALGFQEQEQIRQQALPSSLEEKPTVSADTRQAMASIQNMDSRTAVQSGVALDVLGAAQLSANRPDAALNTANDALRKEPTSPRLHYLRALALHRLGRMGDALEALRSARAALSPTSSADLRASIYKSLTYKLLYEGTAEAARGVVLLAEEYLKVDPTGADGSILVNLACAHGQLAKFAGADVDAVREHGLAALAAIQAALKQDSAWLSKLRSLYHPAPNSPDDDLAVFAQSPLASQFDDALGLKATSAKA